MDSPLIPGDRECLAACGTAGPSGSEWARDTLDGRLFLASLRRYIPAHLSSPLFPCLRATIAVALLSRYLADMSAGALQI